VRVTTGFAGDVKVEAPTVTTEEMTFGSEQILIADFVILMNEIHNEKDSILYFSSNLFPYSNSNYSVVVPTAKEIKNPKFAAIKRISVTLITRLPSLPHLDVQHYRTFLFVFLLSMLLP